jgi:prephenate dehydratase/prephenate dehydrogenase
MVSIATLGPAGSDSYLAAKQYNPDAELVCFNSMYELLSAYQAGKAGLALIPVYNTREGEIKEYFRFLIELKGYYWVDNVVLPIHLSIGAIDSAVAVIDTTIDTIVGRGSVFNQCKDYLKANFPDATLITVHDIEAKLREIKEQSLVNHGIIESEELLRKFGFSLLDREVVSHNKTRFAVLSSKPAGTTGYDATAVITRPLRDRVGMLVDILGEFTRRGINILDLRSENDIETQKLQIYLEIEGHCTDSIVREALTSVERGVIQEENALKVLGSFPRVDMRVKRIRSFGFIGTGDMSKWFATRLRNEGYTTHLAGRSTPMTPEKMIPQVDVVVICVPISVTSATIQQYGHLLKEGQALILLAGESENTLKTAFASTEEGVEVMLVHNLWGPQAATMKDKNAAVVRTRRSGSFCSEFESFLYKHGAEIYQDNANQHDLLMGFVQKLPTMISVALASTLVRHNIECNDIGSHSTLTSIYGILAMARIHSQNPRTYAEIMSTKGDGRRIVKTFVDSLQQIIDLAEKEDIDTLCELMETNRGYMSSIFLESRMKQAKAVDEVLNESGVNYHF